MSIPSALAIRSTLGIRVMTLSTLAAMICTLYTVTAGAVCAPPPVAPLVAGVLPDLSEIKRELTELRGLPFLKDVPAEKQSLEDFDTFLQAELEKTFPPGKEADMQAALLRLGMLLQPIDIGDEFKNALLSQAGAYYDPASGKFFYLMSNVSGDMLKMIASHELVHAIQDQHFHLGPLMEKLDRTFIEGVRQDDQILAVRYLVEGEATYVQTLWQMISARGLRDPQSKSYKQAVRTAHTLVRIQGGLDTAFLVQANKLAVAFMGDAGDEIAKAINSMDKIPPYILHPLVSAYTGGALLVMELKESGGWNAVADAYSDLPVSSEQVMHPEKFAGHRDNPTLLTLPEMGYLKEAGWRAIDSAVHGEFYLNLLLRNFGCQAGAAVVATAGWDGDLYRAYRHEDGRVMFVLATTWDTEKDAAEFLKAYQSILPTKCHLAQPVAEYRTAEGEIAYPSGTAADDTGRLVQRGREVFVVEGAPAQLASRIMDELKSMGIEHVD